VLCRAREEDFRFAFLGVGRSDHVRDTTLPASIYGVDPAVPAACGSTLSLRKASSDRED
jgi:hypothetical protein